MQEEKKELEKINEEIKEEPKAVEKKEQIREEKRQNGKRNFLIVLGILFIWWCVSTIDERFDLLEERIANVSGDIMNINNRDIANEVRFVLEEQSSVLSSSDWDMKILEKKMKTVELTMSVLPKEYIEGMEVTFYADCSDGTKVSVKGKEIEDMKFTGKVEIPACESVDMRVTMQKGDVTQIQKIGSDRVQEHFEVNLYANWLGACFYRDGVVNMDGQVEIELYDDEDGCRSDTMKQMDVVLYVEDKEWKRFPVEIKKDEARYGEAFYYVSMKETIPLEAIEFGEDGKAGEFFQMTVEGEDIYGFHYQNIVMKTHFTKNGECVDNLPHEEKAEVY